MKSSSNFVGRQAELALLNGLQIKDSASLVVVYGRRRIGKSRLIEEFARGSRFYSFAGLSPEPGVKPQDQLDEFRARLLIQCPEIQKKTRGLESKTYTDWSNAFFDLAEETRRGRVVILLDEISWMGHDNPTFLGKLKNAWDMELKNNPQLVLVLCGSVSTWISKNILSNRGFYGRISLKLKLNELPLYDCNQFWESRGGFIADYDKLKILSVTGGVPKYLEEIRADHSVDDNIKRLCFSPEGLLFNDYDYIFSSLLESDSQIYQDIVEALCSGEKTREVLLEALEKKSGGMLTHFLNELESAGFIARDFTWDVRLGKLSKLSQYRLSDNYLRFYIKYILPVFAKVKKNQFQGQALSSFPGWSSIMGLQVENLINNNRMALKRLLGISSDDVLCEGPFFQRKTGRMAGCQIDYLIQSKLGVLYLIEIKFSKNPLTMAVIDEVKDKISRLNRPKNVSILPVLIHLGGIHDSVSDAGFFVRIIDMSEFLYG